MPRTDKRRGAAKGCGLGTTRAPHRRLVRALPKIFGSPVKGCGLGTTRAPSPWQSPFRLVHVQFENEFEFYVDQHSVRWVVNGQWRLMTHDQFTALLKRSGKRGARK